MARSIFSEVASATVVVTMLAMSPLAARAEPPGSKQYISFGSGHFVVSIDPSVERYKLVVEEIPGKCKPELTVEEKGTHLNVVHSELGCKDEIYASFRINPAWASQLEVSLKAGQLDLSTSVIEVSSRINARVKVGDIVGRSGVERAWVVGAKFTLTQDQPGLVINTSVGAGQITFP